MFAFLLDNSVVPFTIALGLLLGLLILELISLVLGGSLLGADSDAPGPDLLDSPDFDPADFDLDAATLATADADVADIAEQTAPEDPGGFANWMGLGKVPTLIWLASLLMAFGLSGLVLQSTLDGLFGWSLPAWLATIPATILGVLFARSFGSVFSRLLPQTETAAVSERHLGRRRGVITQGNASRGRPAEVRVTDRYGNTHHLRAEPLRDDVTLPQGSEVIVLRQKYEGGYLLVPLSN